MCFSLYESAPGRNQQLVPFLDDVAQLKRVAD